MFEIIIKIIDNIRIDLILFWHLIAVVLKSFNYAICMTLLDYSTTICEHNEYHHLESK